MIATDTLNVTPSGAVIGAEVSGMDLRNPMSPGQREEIHSLLARHKVLVWRDQHLDAAGQVDFVQSFGPILEFSSVVDEAPEIPGVHKVKGSTVGWHIDASAQLEPPVATVLRAVVIPPSGGDTIWASGVAAYESLPDDLKQQLDGIYLTHGGSRHLQPGSEAALVCHPLVRTHPVTGERLLYLNSASWNLSIAVGVDRSASDELVQMLSDLYLRPEHQYRLQWSPGAVCMWDNRAVQHTGVHDYGDAPRHMERICLARFDPALACPPEH
ncbi:MAG: TauD/TfdA dioxygenase family protein [Actinomycetota bacterium]